MYIGHNTTSSSAATVKEIVIGSYAIGSGDNTVTIESTTNLSTHLFGNLGLNTTNFGGSIGGSIGIEESAGPSAHNPNGGILYVRNGELRYMGSSGSVTTIAVA